MVLFVNVHVNQRVEVKLSGGRILRGTVHFKGCLNGLRGDWVGLAMDKRVGTHNGLLNGRRYFQCLPGHGIFIKASHLRFIPTIRQLYNQHRFVDTGDGRDDDDDLFYTHRNNVDEEIRGSVNLDRSYSQWAQSDTFPDDDYSPYTDRPSLYHRRHTVGRCLPSACATRRLRTAYDGMRGRPVHVEYGPEYGDDFISSPSIPSTHMPHSALKDQVRRGWDRDHYTRYMSVNTGRDAMKYSQWNDISM